ncbi:MAG: glycosyltransferase [Fusobacterium varium]|uniref:glycosyltransferase n=1 Tax=Fusobacterium varium TaxID=856 RepID=UPI00242D6530|nr:glycosyltransferase [Fusobacterium varium]UYI79855.1 MAG: glycosyltransferase [Fusobacterium varium]
MKKKISFIGPISQKRNIVGGATVKNRYLVEFLEENGIKLEILDTDNWKENKIFLLFKLIYIFLFSSSKKIILSTSSGGTYLFLKLSYYLNIRKKLIYYFVIGGDTPNKLIEKKYKLKYYKKITKIYIETKSMAQKMKDLGLIQTEYLPNFKRFIPKDRSEKEISLPLKAVFFSRISKEKGTDMIFEMLKEVNKDEINISVDFYGPIESGHEKEFFKEINNIKNTYYKGMLDSMEEQTFDILSEYDFMLFPTCCFNEGIPGSIIDAFISSLPIVAARWKNFDEILNSNFSFEFPINNQKSFNKIIIEILENPKKLSEKRKLSYLESRKYCIENVLNKILCEFKKKKGEV